MAGKIFYREREITLETKQPRYILTAVSGVDLKVFGRHIPLTDLKFIAEQVGSELVLCPTVSKDQVGAEEEVEI